MDYVCPSCKSENIQKLSVIYEGGLSNIDAKTTGVIVGSEFASASTSSSTTGTVQTVASKKAAPPEKAGYLGPLFGIFLSYILGLIFFEKHKFITSLMTIAWIIASVGWVCYAFQHNTKTWPKLKETWDKSFLCNRCNEIFCLYN
jgi:hypothetical protein